jgi:hypothetical protein
VERILVERIVEKAVEKAVENIVENNDTGGGSDGPDSKARVLLLWPCGQRLELARPSGSTR